MRPNIARIAARALFPAGLALAGLVLALAVLGPGSAQGARIKDLAQVSGNRTNQLVGYGLVVGLSGTGDKRGSDFTVQSIFNMLDKMGVRVDKATLKPKNVAAVMVTAQMPVSAKPGGRLDVTVSSLGDSSSLLGGVLLVTPLKGVAQHLRHRPGSLLVRRRPRPGGPAPVGVEKHHHRGMIPVGPTWNGPCPSPSTTSPIWTLDPAPPDFSTATRMAKRVNESLGSALATAVDAGTVRLAVPPGHQGNLTQLVASIENIQVTPDSRARVVVDEKTGTVVLGRTSRFRLGRHARATSRSRFKSADVSHPCRFPGKTVATPHTNIGPTRRTASSR